MGLIGAGGQFSRIPEFQFPDVSDAVDGRGGRHECAVFVAHLRYGRTTDPDLHSSRRTGVTLRPRDREGNPLDGAQAIGHL
jgi:hypothetical protein